MARVTDCPLQQKHEDGVHTVKMAPHNLEESGEPFNILNALSSYNRLLTVEDIAYLFGLSKFTIYRMAQKHQIPCLMIGGTRKFDPSTLAAWLTKKEPQLATAARKLKSVA